MALIKSHLFRPLVFFSFYCHPSLLSPSGWIQSQMQCAKDNWTAVWPLHSLDSPRSTNFSSRLNICFDFPLAPVSISCATRSKARLLYLGGPYDYQSIRPILPPGLFLPLLAQVSLSQLPTIFRLASRRRLP